MFQEQKNVCNSSARKYTVIPFTGFKIDHVYKWTGIFPPSNRAFVCITHCMQGKVDYQKYFPVDEDEKEYPDSRGIGLPWTKSFCMLLSPPAKEMNNIKSDTVKNIELSDNPNGSTLSDDGIQTNQWKKVCNLLRKKVDKSLEKVFQLGILHYVGKQLSEHFDDILSSTPEASLAWAARDMACYKFARRKRYAKRDLQFFIPTTFVGGMYQYSVPSESMKKHIKNLSLDLKSLSMPLDIPVTDKALLKPLSPLIAQDITSQSITFNLNPLVGPILITHRVPYLTTATPWDLRFRLSDTPDVYKQTWAGMIDAFEEYSFSAADANLISQTLSITANWFNRITNPFELEKLFANSDAEIAKFQIKKEKIIEMIQKMPLYQRGALLLAGWNKSESIQALNELQSQWDELQD